MERTLFKVTMAEYVSYYTKLEIRDHVLYGDDECLGDAYMYKIETQWVDGDAIPHFESAGYYVADRKKPNK